MRLLIYFPVLAAVTMFVATVSAVELPEKPVELKKAANDFINLRIRDADEPIAKRRQTLRENYRKALEKAAAEATPKGDLETLLEIRKETDRLKAGEPPPAIDSFQSAKMRVLFETLVKYERKLVADDLKIRKSFARNFAQELKTLQIDLTKQGRVDDAIVVKEYAESADAVDLVAGDLSVPGRIAMRHPIALVLNPGNPSVPAGQTSVLFGESFDGSALEGSTRVVMVPIEEGTEPPSTFRAIEKADRKDLAFVGRTILPSVGFVSKHGALVLWREGTEEPEIVSGSNVYCESSFGIPLVGLEKDGSLVCSEDSDDDTSLLADIREQRDVVEICAASSVLSVVIANGEVRVLGPRADHPTTELIQKMNGVRSVAFSGAAFASVVKKDGSVVDISNGSPRAVGFSGRIEKAIAFRMGIEEVTGRIVNWGTIPDELFEKIGNNPSRVFQEGRQLAAISEDGSFFVATRSDTGLWKELEGYNVALDGALSFAWLFDSDQSWIVALLPSEEVRRSGVWSLEDLIRERRVR